MIPSPLAWVVTLVAIQRLAELVLAARNTRRLIARGGREVGAGHYPLMVLLHGAWLVALVFSTPADRAPNWLLLTLYGLLQLARVWVIASLGEFWTTRIVTLDGAPLVRRGPYRFVRHPNYWIVVAEIALLPLAFGNWPVAVIFSVLNGLMLRHRIGVEQAALAPRMAKADDAA